MSFPLKAGATQVKVDIALSANLPASLASTTATATNGDKLFCIEIKSSKEAETTSHVLPRENQDYPVASVNAPVAGDLTATASATDLKLTWSDCGDASTKAKITSFSPDHLTLGQTTTMVGTGTRSEDVSAATYD